MHRAPRIPGDQTLVFGQIEQMRQAAQAKIEQAFNKLKK